MTQNKFYSIYRSYNDYYDLFIKKGFEFISEIKLFEDDDVINAFRIWQLNDYKIDHFCSRHKAVR